MDDSYGNRLAAAAMGMGVLLSPDTMVLLGNFMGKTGGYGLGLLAGTMILFVFISPVLKSGHPFEKRAADSWVGSRFIYVPLIVKGAAAIFLSTGILVSSGFVFNEVFVYWFPNFGFAFVLLAAALGIQLAGTRTVLRAQVIFAGAALACFIVLVGSGLGRIASPPVPAGFPGPGAASLPLLLWVGFDLVWSAPEKSDTRAPAVQVIVLAGILFLTWGLMSAAHVPLNKLSDSGIPHMKAARAVLGESGRYLMGSAVILGTLAAVNALFTVVGTTAGHLSDAGRMPRWTKNRVILPLVLAAAVATMMATGMAGSDRLEIWIRAAFLLWLMTYVGYSANALKQRFTLSGLALTLLLGAGWACLALYGEAESVLYMAAILGAGLAPGLISVFRSTLQKNTE